MSEHFELTELEKQKIKELLNKHSQLKGSNELPDWNIKAQTLLIFIAMRNPDLVSEADR